MADHDFPLTAAEDEHTQAGAVGGARSASGGGLSSTTHPNPRQGVMITMRSTAVSQGFHRDSATRFGVAPRSGILLKAGCQSAAVVQVALGDR